MPAVGAIAAARGPDPRFEIYAGDDPVAFVVSCNLQRRHLNASQCAAIAAKLDAVDRA
jgi:hypothetical protein